MTTYIQIAAPDDLVKKIDKCRGDVPRSKYCLRFIETCMVGEKQHNPYKFKSIIKQIEDEGEST